MPNTKKHKLLYAFITVAITVPCFVIYCLSIEKKGILNIDWNFALTLMPIEFILAYTSEIFIGSPLSLKIAFSKTPPDKYDSSAVETSIICATVLIMCPWMSFLATILYKGIFPAFVFHEKLALSSFLINFIPNYLQTVVINFPFALLGQLFFIQPITRKIFGLITIKRKHKSLRNA